MIAFTAEMRERISNALADRLPCLLGTASKDGRPQISMKGSVLAYDDQTLAYWERSKRTALENVAENPHVVIFYRNAAERITWRFHGTAAIYDAGPVRDEVLGRTVQAELDRDPDLQGVAVLVNVDKITDLAGNVIQQRD